LEVHIQEDNEDNGIGESEDILYIITMEGFNDVLQRTKNKVPDFISLENMVSKLKKDIHINSQRYSRINGTIKRNFGTHISIDTKVCLSNICQEYLLIMIPKFGF
jgi:hypothetical protein